MGGPRILIVDDERAVRELWVDALAAFGFEVAAAEDGLDALGRLEGDSCDLIVSDLLMPRLGGWGLLEAIRQRYPSLPFILITGHARRSDFERADREQVTLLEKPVTVRDLYRDVHRLLASRER